MTILRPRLGQIKLQRHAGEFLSAPWALYVIDLAEVVQSVIPVQARHQVVHQHSHSKRQTLARGIHRIHRHLWQLPFRQQPY